jgi:hypothetical protein
MNKKDKNSKKDDIIFGAVAIGTYFLPIIFFLNNILGTKPEPTTIYDAIKFYMIFILVGLGGIGVGSLLVHRLGIIMGYIDE